MSNDTSNTSTQLNHGANAILDATSESAAKVMDTVSTEAHNMAQRSSRLLQDSTAQVRKQADAAREATRGYIQQDPLKAVLIAAATGASLVLLGSLLSRSSRN